MVTNVKPQIINHFVLTVYDLFYEERDISKTLSI